jgi:hypothetical protein
VPDCWAIRLHPVFAGIYPIPNSTKSIGQIEIAKFVGNGISFTMLEDLKGLTNLKPLSWCNSMVVQDHLKFWFSAMRVAPVEPNITDLNIGSCLGAPHISCDLERLPDIVDTSASYDGHTYSGYKHVESPTRHFRLSYKVALGALIFICGFYYFGHAFRNISTLSVETGGAYLVLGMSLIFCGVFIALASGFSYL